MKIIAIVPIKSNSNRIPGKNFKLLGNKPLFHYILETLTNCYPIVNKIVVNTDSSVIMTECAKHFPNILVYTRPKDLCGDGVSVNLLIKDTINYINESNIYPEENIIYFQTHVTNPFLSKDTIFKALDIFHRKLTKNNPNSIPNDSLFSVNSYQTRLYNENAQPINHDTNNLLPTQMLEPIYEENSCIYIFTQESFLKRDHRIGKNPYLFKIPSKIESLDIDWEEDFQLANVIASNLYSKDIINSNENSSDNSKENYNNNPSDNSKNHSNKENLNKKTVPKTVLITGASGGIGLATSEYFKDKGWQVIGIDISLQTLKSKDNETFKEYWSMDLTKETSIKNIVAKLKNLIEQDIISGLDGLVNIAAIQSCNSILKTKSSEWDRVINCNLKSVFFLSQALAPFLKKTQGSIVNITSVHSLQSSDKIAVYAASKSGLLGLTRNMAIEFAPLGIRVNCLSPGAVDTPMLRSGLTRSCQRKTIPIETLLEDLGNKHLSKRVGKPEEIASGIFFLINNETASFIFGSNLVVDGGATIKLSTE